MESPNKKIYDLLKTIENVVVYQSRPEVLTTFPCITFFISDNRPTYVLEGDLAFQNIEVTIDIWAESSDESGELLTTVEELMREEKILLLDSRNIPDPDMISHIATRFYFSN